jgi:hypothetical protein
MSRKNLRKLANYLLNLPKGYVHFDMNLIAEIPSSSEDGPEPIDAAKFFKNCGAVGCALGHGPAAGIKAHAWEDWFSYCQRVFGFDDQSAGWSWAFDESWRELDNTPQGAALRIFYMLDFGIPSKFTGADQEHFGKYKNAYDIIDY